MGIINVQIPSGETVKVDIAGEKPTEKEIEVILKNFTSDAPLRPDAPGLDFLQPLQRKYKNMHVNVEPWVLIL